MAVVLQRGCRHGGMRLHDVRIHVLLRLSANLLHAMGGWIGLYAVMRRQRVTAAVFAASPVAALLDRSYALLLGWESMSRVRVRMVCVAIGVCVVGDMNAVV